MVRQEDGVSEAAARTPGGVLAPLDEQLPMSLVYDVTAKWAAAFHSNDHSEQYSIAHCAMSVSRLPSTDSVLLAATAVKLKQL